MTPEEIYKHIAAQVDDDMLRQFAKQMGLIAGPPDPSNENTISIVIVGNE